MTSRISEWQPDWSVPPGEILSEELATRGMSQSELARRMDRPVKTINEIVNAKASVTPDTALQLELALGISAGLWMGLETNYRRHLAQERALLEMEQHDAWARAFPISDLRRHGLIDPAAKQGAPLVASLLAFFGVSSVRAWTKQWQAPQAAYRKSRAFTSSPHATAAWLRWGEIQASEVTTAPFNAHRLLQVLADARSMTRQEPFSDVIEELREKLAACGVALVLTPEVQGARVSGAARWVKTNQALVQLSLRHKSNDQFWFSLFHEAAHLLEERRTDHVDTVDDDRAVDDAERAADQRARNLLIDPTTYELFVTNHQFDTTSVRDLAAILGVAPGLVVGRLQRDRYLAPNQLNGLKKPLRWS